jgi:glycosyltransferase involved in cell wall biosynthesis
VLEALACGTPVVATAVGGIPEQIEEARTGFLAPEGDVAGLAARMTQVLLGPDLRQRMGMLAAESARQRFDLDRQVDAYLDWYHEVVLGLLPKKTKSRSNALPMNTFGQPT